MSLNQTIRYCTTADGVRLAYAVSGEGPPMVKAANWFGHLELEWRGKVWGPWLREFSSKRRLIRYDVRGTGLSERFPEKVSFDLFVSDLEAVVEAARLERFALFGMSQGAAAAIEYALRHPERVTHLVLFNGFSRGAAHRQGVGQGREMVEAMCTLIRQGWGSDDPSFRQVFTTQLMPEATAEQVDEWNRLERESVSGEMASRIFHAVQTEIDLTDRLGQLKVPTLVLHSRGDRRVPFEQGRELAARIPDARFVQVESNNHMPLVQDPGYRRALDEIDRFSGATPSRAAQLRRRALDLRRTTGEAIGTIEASTMYKLLAIGAVLATLASLIL